MDARTELIVTLYEGAWATCGTPIMDTAEYVTTDRTESDRDEPRIAMYEALKDIQKAAFAKSWPGKQ
jgi:ketol-acid reductoisomerase